MIVTGPARDGTRLGLIDVGVPRYISTKEARPHTGLLFYWRGETCRSKDRRYKTVRVCFAGIEMGLEEVRDGSRHMVSFEQTACAELKLWDWRNVFICRRDFICLINRRSKLY